jgi:hypothetical protein
MDHGKIGRKIPPLQRDNHGTIQTQRRKFFFSDECGE